MHHYYLRTEAGLKALRFHNEKQVGCSFEAVVQAVKEDQVQIDVKGDENSSQSVYRWFTYSTVYSTPDGTGWYCMPEISDTVRLYIPDQNENQAYVASSVHLEVSGSDRKNPDEKSIMNKYRKEIRFTPDKLILTNNKGIKIEISDSEGINITSNKAIHLKAQQNVTVSSENGALMIAGTEAVAVSQSGASILLDDDISFTGGEFRIQ